MGAAAAVGVGVAATASDGDTDPVTATDGVPVAEQPEIKAAVAASVRARTRSDASRLGDGAIHSFPDAVAPAHEGRSRRWHRATHGDRWDTAKVGTRAP